MKKIGKRLQELRESKGLSQVKVKLNHRFLELPYYFSCSCYIVICYFTYLILLFFKVLKYSIHQYHYFLKKSKIFDFVIILIFYLFLFFLLKKY